MDNFFGAPSGKLDDPVAGELKNDFSNISDRSVSDMAKTDRIIPRQTTTGVLRGTQRISNTDGSYILLGVLPDSNGEFGIAFYDASDNVVTKSLGATDYKYDLNTGKNYYQNGKLPDGSYGTVFMKPNYNVSDAFS